MNDKEMRAARQARRERQRIVPLEAPAPAPEATVSAPAAVLQFHANDLATYDVDGLLQEIVAGEAVVAPEIDPEIDLSPVLINGEALLVTPAEKAELVESAVILAEAAPKKPGFFARTAGFVKMAVTSPVHLIGSAIKSASNGVRAATAVSRAAGILATEVVKASVKETVADFGGVCTPTIEDKAAFATGATAANSFCRRMRLAFMASLGFGWVMRREVVAVAIGFAAAKVAVMTIGAKAAVMTSLALLAMAGIAWVVAYLVATLVCSVLVAVYEYRYQAQPAV